MIQININRNDPTSEIRLYGSNDDVSMEFYSMFTHLSKIDYFRAALFAYLESDDELREEFMTYHVSETTKDINSIIDKLFGEGDE